MGALGLEGSPSGEARITPMRDGISPKQAGRSETCRHGFWCGLVNGQAGRASAEARVEFAL